MAGTAKSWYLSIADREDKLKNVVYKMFLKAADMNKFIADNLEKYPKDRYIYTKETY